MNKNVYYYIKDTLKLAPEKYINSGVLIINSKKYIEQKIKEKFLQRVKNNYRFLDQDIINIICYGQITLLPDKWNYQWHNHNENNALMAKQADYDQIARKPSILHFTTRRKGWNTPNWDLADRFWYYAAHTAFFDEIVQANPDAVKIAKYDIKNVQEVNKPSEDQSESNKKKMQQLQAVYDQEIECLLVKLKRFELDLTEVHNSLSFRIGRGITWLPRKIRGCFRCLRRNGFVYTLIRILCGKNKAEEHKMKKNRKIRG